METDWELAENDPPRPLPDEGDLRAAFRLHERRFSPAIASGLAELSVRLVGGVPRVCLSPGGNVGFVSLGRSSFHVRPKLPGTNWLALAAMAGEFGDLRWQEMPPALGASDDPSMPGLLLAAFARAAEDFLRTGPRRLHGPRREV
ncbi:MAG: hypothetical protein K2W96_05300, partial [Gemmataceae bacterium]|nr:hypothetical protein [Gemmataceae bacterium]